ncbi:MAG TPA: low specificity L-threonine aldolase [Streptosporangiaceae bacterium]|nr:low specificity L-threonine aldolase [Streptosporangiaceae bacterium]
MTTRKSFGSDNHAGAHEAVLRMMNLANEGDAHAYGDDPWTGRVARDLCGLSGARAAYFVFNGTAANILGLSLMLHPYEAVICAETAHLNVDECGAAERLLGSKLLTVPTPDGKLTPDLVATRLGGRNDEHRAQPRAVCITQVTELGTCYSLAELRVLREFCRGNDLRLYIDGARLANAVAYLDCPVADIAAQADVLSFGGTKNGAVAAEAVLVMAEDLLGAVPFQRKQLLQLASKMRFLAAQFAGLLEDQIWLRNAAHSNLMARRLATGLGDVPGVSVAQAVQSNAVFADLDPRIIGLLQDDWGFYVWDDQRNTVRLMTAFDTTADDVDSFLASIRAASGSRV